MLKSVEDILEMCHVVPGKKLKLKNHDPGWEGDRDVPEKERRAKAEELLQVVIERAKEQVINLTRWFDILLNMNIVNHHFKLFLNFNILTEPKFRGISALSIQ